MRLNEANIVGMRLNEADVVEARLNEDIVFSSKPLYKQDGLMALFMGDNKTNASPNKNTWKNLGSGGNFTLLNFAYTESSGWTGDGLQFDSVDDQTNVITLPDNVYTIEYVFSRPAYWYSRCPVSNRLTNVSNGAGLKGFALSSQTYNDGTGAKFWLFHGTETTIIDNPLVAGAHHHICATFNQADTKFRVYIDGVLNATIDNTTFEPHNQLVVGRLSTNHGSSIFHGAVFNIRAYDRYLTPEEILHNYNIDKEAYGV